MCGLMCGRLCWRSRRFFWHLGPTSRLRGWEDFRRRSRASQAPLVLRLVARKRGAGQEHRNNDVASSRTIPCHPDRLTNDAAFWRRVSPKLAHRELPSTRCCATGLRSAARRRRSQGERGRQLCQWHRARPPEIAGNGGYGLAGCVWPKPSRPAEKAKGQHPMKKRARPA